MFAGMITAGQRSCTAKRSAAGDLPAHESGGAGPRQRKANRAGPLVAMPCFAYLCPFVFSTARFPLHHAARFLCGRSGSMRIRYSGYRPVELTGHQELPL